MLSAPFNGLCGMYTIAALKSRFNASSICDSIYMGKPSFDYKHKYTNDAYNKNWFDINTVGYYFNTVHLRVDGDYTLIDSLPDKPFILSHGGHVWLLPDSMG